MNSRKYATLDLAKRPECKDCFARTTNGFCHCLTNTDFGNRKCPFYCNKNKAKQQRLAIDGADDYKYLIEEGIYIEGGGVMSNDI